MTDQPGEAISSAQCQQMESMHDDDDDDVDPVLQIFSYQLATIITYCLPVTKCELQCANYIMQTNEPSKDVNCTGIKSAGCLIMGSTVGVKIIFSQLYKCKFHSLFS